MITLTIEDVELFDSTKNEFYIIKGGVFSFRHSLKAVSLWEADFKKPFMTTELTKDELKSYCVYMCLDPGLSQAHITDSVYKKLTDYINDSRTATRIRRENTSGVSSVQTITSELIYSMMVAAGVPFETENWNLNRLLVLLDVISVQNKPKEKMSREDIYKQNRRLNEKRKQELNTKG